MLELGVNVCLATDSIVNIPPDQAERISPLDDARLLHAREKPDASTLLRMITLNPARALGLDADRYRLRPGPVAGLVAADVADTPDHLGPAERLMTSAGPFAPLPAGAPA